MSAFAELDLTAHLPDGTGKRNELDLAAAELQLLQADEAGELAWADKVRHAVAAALVAEQPEALREDVLRAAALLLGWLYDLDRRAVFAEPLQAPAPARLRRRLQRFRRRV